ncbi:MULTISPECIES: CobW family GTP-binding protein [unclassified Rhizobium]|uniref:CobW family GTP-binding protein n=1 Tax=unclassified Rhizobium TaxID=2613769 RepID=UPI001ADAD723|nr:MULTISPECIES: GTP-binding protein [unclassified Rhizobium]MBO9101400.1 GTP-binding protein [Rhizobium sp. L58/93]QXZ86816.1 GTP-binding protein [Rhizobium sp. K1/93]QXZ93151.1 GTP-binding protein [Rhizobium sp. K15/93]
MADDYPAFTPVNLLTGFLGSGKTTLLRRMLGDPAMANTAVLINEFGEIGLDHHLLERIDETMVLLQSGCLCCTVRGELAEALRDLHAKREKGLVPAFDRVVIESTGLADPFPVLSTLKADPVLRHHFKASTTIATVDAVNATVQRSRSEFARQVSVADHIVLTKTDLSSLSQEDSAVAAIRALNPDATILRGAGDDLDLRRLLVDDASGEMSLFRCDEPLVGDGSIHTGKIQSFVLKAETAVDWTAFGIWLTMLLNRHGDRILRVKGILNVAGEPRPVAIHGVQYLVHPPTHMQAWPSQDRHSAVVFIVDGIDPSLIVRSFQAFNALG